MTYYKYAERESDSQVNWAEVSKGLSDTILQVDKDRREKKAGIDAATREAQTTLANAPKGENTTASAWTINYANDMMNYRLTLDRLLKSGQMKLSDYQVAAQNSVDSTNLVFTISQEYQDEYKAIMDRSRTLGKNGLPLSSVMELELASLNESYSNLSNTVPTINSTNGMVYLSTPGTGKDGVQTLGDNYVSLQSLRNRMKAKVDMYDLEGVSASKVAALGENTISQLGQTNFRRTGVVTDITDATLRDTWTEFTKTTAKEMVANPFSQASIMADSMKVNPKTGQAYKGVYNRAEWEADKTGNLILFENTNGTGPLVPVFTEQQTKDAEAFVQAGLSKYVDKKTESRPFTEPGVDYAPEYVVNRGDKTKKDNNSGNMLAKLYSGDSAEIQSAVDYFNGLSDVDAVKRTADGVVVTLSNGNTDTIKFKNPDGTLKTQADFIRSASKLLVGDDADLNAVLKGAVGTGKKAFNTTGSASAAVQKPAPAEDVSKTYSSHVSKVTSSMLKPTVVTSSYYGQKVKGFKSDDGKTILSEEQVADKLNSSLQGLGFEVSVPTKYGNYISIKNRDGVETQVALDEPDNALKAIQGFITSNVPGKDAVERNVYLQDLKSKGVFGGGASKFSPK